MITTLLPWAALLLAVLALFSRDGVRVEGRGEGWLARLHPCYSHLWAAGALIVLVLAAGYVLREELKLVWESSIGFAVGVAVAAAALKASRLPSQPKDGFGAPVAIGLFGAAIWTLLEPGTREPYQLGAVVGAGLGAWLLAGAPDGQWAPKASIFMGLAVLADVLGQRAAAGHSANAGSAFGVLIALALILALGIPRTGETESRNRAIGIGIAAVAFAAGAWLLASRYLFINDIWIIFVGAAGVGLVAGWIVPDTEEDQGSFNFVLSVVIWLAVATLAFGLRRGYGMSIAALGGASMLAVLGRRRALLALAPLIAIVVYRIFREMHTESSRALDIGQHYALIGLAVGAALPVLASEWRASNRPSRAGVAWASMLWVPVVLAVPYVAGVVLAVKGYIGVLAGTGFGPFIEGLRGGSRIESLSLQLGLSTALAASFGWIVDKLNLARAEKIAALVWVVVGLAVVAMAIGLLSRGANKEVVGSDA